MTALSLRQRVRDKIARDREERALKVLTAPTASDSYAELLLNNVCISFIERVECTNPFYASLLQFGGGSSSRAVTSPSAEGPPSSPPSQGPPPAKKDYNECRIQVRGNGCLWPSSHSVHTHN